MSENENSQAWKVTLTINHPVPSLNTLFNLHWIEAQDEKKRTQIAVQQALQNGAASAQKTLDTMSKSSASDAASLTAITHARNFLQTRSDTLARYLTMHREKHGSSPSSKSKSPKITRSGRKSSS